MKQDKITVVVVEPLTPAKVVEIDNTLEAKQKIVNGYIECIYPFDDDVCLICNEEGKLNGEMLNRGLFDDNGKLWDIIAGTFIIAGSGDEEFVSLTEEQQKHYLAMYTKAPLITREWIQSHM